MIWIRTNIMAALTQYRIMEAWEDTRKLRSLILLRLLCMSFDGILIKKPVIIEDENGDKIGIRKMGFLGRFDHEHLWGLLKFFKKVKKN
ncbi:MAG: hypothetical protein CM15mP111_1210 [Hyphomicrobiales bacterium]|nr:MAG: hypothetical protein CM15mP111_1210 [Hyphomicrobiales bacterium]